MLGRKMVLSVLALVAAATVTQGAAAGEKGGLVKWKTDPKKAMAEARARGAGMMLYFTSEG